jgi:uncharacterized metal-binding protein
MGRNRKEFWNEKDYTVISCSGACDTGEIADITARRLRYNLVRSMNSLASIGAYNQDLIDRLKKSNLLLIDGCKVECAKKITENAGICNFHHLKVTDLGYEKGETGVTEDVLHHVYLTAEKLI